MAPTFTDDPIDTPALVVDLDALERNLERLARDCAAAGRAFRPHSKTHKSPWVAARQGSHGAVGVCAAKLGEAEVLVAGGIDDVLITTELEPSKFGRLLDLCELARVSVAADDPQRVSALAKAAAARGVEVPVLVDVNVAGRTGVDTPEQAIEVARAATAGGVRLAGLQGFEGHLQHVVDEDERRRGAFEAYDRLAEIARALAGAGLEVDCISAAGTGTYKFALAHGTPTEVQAGSYVFFDSRYATVEGIEFENALFVVAGVVSRRRAGELIIDAGFKTLSTDDGMPSVAGDGDARYEPAGDEHGRVRGVAADAERVWIVPSHCDTTVNLHDRYVLLRGGRVVGELPVAARGRVR
jgi:D-serine deaminase-like pyridoxal phosphate-dependent protein